MNYRCLYETFINVEANSEEEAQTKAVEQLCIDLKKNPEQVIVWVSDQP